MGEKVQGGELAPFRSIDWQMSAKCQRIEFGRPRGGRWLDNGTFKAE